MKKKKASLITMEKNLIVLFLMLIVGCSHNRELTEIKPRIIHPGIIEDTLGVAFNDAVFTAVEVIKNDTVKYIEFKPDSLLLSKVKELQKENIKLKNFGNIYFRIKPDSIVLWDTVKVFQTIEKKIETPFLSKLGLVLIGIVITVTACMIIRR